MKMCLVMILVKKVFIFSKTMIICLLCPLLCGLFFFWKGAKGELSYKVRKNPALQDSPPAAGRFCDILPFRRRAILPGGLFNIIGDSTGISYDIKKSAMKLSSLPIKMSVYYRNRTYHRVLGEFPPVVTPGKAKSIQTRLRHYKIPFPNQLDSI